MSVLRMLLFAIIGTEPKSYLTSAKDLDDKALVKQIRASKDSQLFGILYDRYSNKVYNKCRGFTQNDAEAKDLTQDIFLKVFLKLDLYNDDKAGFSTWLYVVTYNFCVNYVNREKKKTQSERLDDHEFHLSSNNEAVGIKDLNLLDVVKMNRAIQLLLPEEKALLLLKYQDNVSISELQDSLKIGKSAVKMRLKRARSKVVNIYHTL